MSTEKHDGGRSKVMRMEHSFLDANRFAAHVAEELHKREKTSYSRLCLVGAVFGSLALLLLTAGGIALAIDHSATQKVGPGDVLLNKDDGQPLRVQQHYLSVPLMAINKIPLEQVEKIATMQFQWGADDYGGPREYYFNVESLFRDKSSHTAEVRLSSGHVLTITNEIATLKNSEGIVLGVHDFAKAEAHIESKLNAGSEPDDSRAPNGSDEPKVTVRGSSIRQSWTKTALAKVESDITRKLGKKDKKRGAVGVGGSGRDDWCAYGCGQMAVTYPYYYRPFFGYGYPLVGLEQMFEPGYGGNPVTALAANGLMNSANSPGPLTGVGV